MIAPSLRLSVPLIVTGLVLLVGGCALEAQPAATMVAPSHNERQTSRDWPVELSDVLEARRDARKLPLDSLQRLDATLVRQSLETIPPGHDRDVFERYLNSESVPSIIAMPDSVGAVLAGRLNGIRAEEQWRRNMGIRR